MYTVEIKISLKVALGFIDYNLQHIPSEQQLCLENIMITVSFKLHLIVYGFFFTLSRNSQTIVGYSNLTSLIYHNVAFPFVQLLFAAKSTVNQP